MRKNYQKLRVTLPQNTDLIGATVGLTDFAIFSAPKPQQFGRRRVLSLHEIDVPSGKRYVTGDVWLSQVSHLVPEMMLAHECETGLTFAREPEATDVAVLPQLQKIAATKFGSITIDQQQYLTVNNQIATYPMTAVKSRLANKLTACVNRGDPAVTIIGHVFMPTGSAVVSARIYQYAGQNYVYAINKNHEPQWFHCEPVRVKEVAKNQLQLLDGLLVTPFAAETEFSAKQDMGERSGKIDTDNFVIGQYLNFIFTQNLQKLALPAATIVNQLNQNHKLRHLVAHFAQATKKLGATIRER